MSAVCQWLLTTEGVSSVPVATDNYVSSAAPLSPQTSALASNRLVTDRQTDRQTVVDMLPASQDMITTERTPNNLTKGHNHRSFGKLKHAVEGQSGFLFILGK